MIQEEMQELRDMVGALLKQAQDKKEDLVSSTTNWDQEELISKNIPALKSAMTQRVTDLLFIAGKMDDIARVPNRDIIEP
jgi:hypothetical protein